jgi:hypothetical protein
MINYYPGKDLIFEKYCFVHNGHYYLSTVKVYEGGGIECWGSMTKQEFIEKTNYGWITVDIPDGEELRIGDIGLIVSQAKTELPTFRFDHKWITQESFVKDVLDAYYVSIGNKSVSELCFEAYKAYLAMPSKKNEERLRVAYNEVPEHNRHYVLGDQDLKDFPIRRILGI